MELRTSGDRAVLVGRDGPDEREVDPTVLALPGELASALHEWARVVAAVHRSGPTTERAAANSVVSRRGRQLAGRVAASMGTPVSYRDPMTGDVSVVDVATPEVTTTVTATRETREPTPWATGLTVTAFVAIVTSAAVLTLASTLDETSHWLALGANVVVTAGLSPSMWLARKVPVWRWVAFGAAAGLAVGWLGLPFILFSAGVHPA